MKGHLVEEKGADFTSNPPNPHPSTRVCTVPGQCLLDLRAVTQQTPQPECRKTVQAEEG